jgi:hypothetical protein
MVIAFFKRKDTRRCEKSAQQYPVRKFVLQLKFGYVCQVKGDQSPTIHWRRGGGHDITDQGGYGCRVVAVLMLDHDATPFLVDYWGKSKF